MEASERTMVGLTIRDVGVAEARAIAVEAEAVEAVHSLLVPEGLGDRDGFVVSAAMLSVTERVSVATGVLSIPMRSVVQTVAGGVTLSELSGGRFVLGVGSGNSYALARAGIEPPVSPLGVVRDFVSYYQHLRTEGGDPLNCDGLSIGSIAYRSIAHGVSLPPLAIAAHNPGMLSLAARFADSILLNMQPRSEVSRAVALIRERAGGNDPRIACYVPTLFGDGAEEGAATVIASFCLSAVFRARLSKGGSVYAGAADGVAAAMKWGGPEAAIAAVPEEMVDDIAITDSASLPGRVAALVSAGVDLPVLSIFPAPLRLKQFFPPLPEGGMVAALRNALAVLGAERPDADRDRVGAGRPGGR